MASTFMLDTNGDEHEIHVPGNVAHLMDIGWAPKPDPADDLPKSEDDWDAIFSHRGMVAPGPHVTPHTADWLSGCEALLHAMACKIDR